MRIAALARRYGAAYTRYADDMCFSSDDTDLPDILPALEYVLAREGYVLNRKKTAVMRRNRRQAVTGATVNAKVNIPRHARRLLRARMHGLEAALAAVRRSSDK